MPKMMTLDEQLLVALGIPMLMEILHLSISGLLPAVQKLDGVGAGSTVFTETRFVWDKNPLQEAVGNCLLNRGLIEKSRDEWDAHVRVTMKGILLIEKSLVVTELVEK